MDGGDGSTICIYLMPLNWTLKNGENVNFMLYFVFYHNIFLEFYLFITIYLWILEREGERDRNIDAKETSIGCLPNMPQLRLGKEPGTQIRALY